MRGRFPPVRFSGSVKTGAFSSVSDLLFGLGFPRFCTAESSISEPSAPASVILSVPPVYPFDEEPSSENSGFVALRKVN